MIYYEINDLDKNRIVQYNKIESVLLKLNKEGQKDKLIEFLASSLGGLVLLSQTMEYMIEVLYFLLKKLDSDSDILVADFLASIRPENLKSYVNSIKNKKFTLGRAKQLIAKFADLSSIEEQLDKINKNRNYFIHHFFVDNPDCIKNKDKITKSAHEISFTLIIMGQAIDQLFSLVLKQIKVKYPLSYHYLNSFRDYFIGTY